MWLEDFKVDGNTPYKDTLSKATKVAQAIAFSTMIAITQAGCSESSSSETCSHEKKVVIVSKSPDEALKNPLKIKNKSSWEELYISRDDWKTIVWCMQSSTGVLVEWWEEDVTLSAEWWEALSAPTRSSGARYVPVSMYNSWWHTFTSTPYTWAHSFPHGWTWFHASAAHGWMAHASSAHGTSSHGAIGFSWAHGTS